MLFSLVLGLAGYAAPIGSWNIYYGYHGISEIQLAGHLIYVLSSKGLYSYNTNDKSVQAYDKMNYLSDCGIVHIAYASDPRKLLIVYENQNMDILDRNGNVTNLSSYYRQSMMEDKTVNSINVVGNYAYLSTAFGILKVNLQAEEISETYNLGFNVAYSYIQNGYIYAESKTAGAYSASLSSNLLDKNNWKRSGEYGGLVKDLTKMTDENTKITWAEADNGGLKGYVTDDNGQQTIVADGIKPDGPRYNYFGFLRFTDGVLYSVGGGYGAAGESNNPAAVQTYDQQQWTLYEEDIESRIGHRYIDMLSIAVDPTDKSHVAVSGKSGVYEFQSGKLYKHHNYTNSPLLSALTNNPNYVIVPSVIYDASGSLWCFNSRVSDASLFSLGKDGTWKSHHQSAFLNKGGKSLNDVRGLMFDSRKLLWLVNDHWDLPSFYCYDTQNNGVNEYRQFNNQDGVARTPNYVRCIAEDLNGDMWIGTNVGPFVLYSSQLSQGSNVALTQVKVPRNDGTNLADYLLDGVNVTSIAIDGAGRKWIGTGDNGVYLISEDNNTQIHHFLSSNSRLISDNIQSIAINGTTGEVFFATDKGLCSYMSDATTPTEEMTKDNVYAYPNPVTPDYTGLITIVGLSYDADVKIVTTNGTLVAQGRSNGGTFTWDGTDLKGKRVAGGMYMVLAATSEGEKGTVCKIAIVR